MSSSSPPDSPASPELDSAEPAPGRWRRIFGRLDWQPPGWVPATAAKVRANPRNYVGGLAALLLVASVGYWLATRPTPVRPDAVSVKVLAPALTDYAATPKMVVNPLRLFFSKSAAPIKDVGHAPKGVAMEPELAGSWEWSGDRALVFTPTADWPVGQDYTITLDPKTTVAVGVFLEKTEFEFSTTPFSARMGSSEFYQDPIDPTLKKGVYELAFSHPVDAASLEGKIKLALKDGAARSLPGPSHTISYDERRLKAWVHSQSLQMPENGGLLTLDVAPGIASSLGGEGSKVALKGQVALPSLYSVSVDSATSTLVDNERFEPEQVLVLEFNNAMKDSDVAAATKLWLLPEKNPKLKPDQQRGIYRWSQSEVDESILKLSQPVATVAMPTEREYIESHSLKYHAPPKRFVYVRVARGLKSFGGFILGAPYAAVTEVPEYPQLLRFLGDGALLSLQGERRISIVSRNLPRARLEIGRVLPEQLQHLAFNNYGSYARPELGGVAADSLVERVEQRLELPADDPAKAHYEGVDLGKFLTAGRRGIFMLSLRTMSDFDATQTAQQTLARNAGEEKDSRLVVLTDLGIIIKKALDGSRDVFVQSLSDGKPVAGAQVKVIARNGETLVEAATDGEGHARMPNLDGFQREKQPVMLTVGKADDFSFLPMGDGGRTLDYSRFDIGGEPNEVETGTLKAFLFSDRGLYRPGDRINLGIIVRAVDWKRPLKGLPLELVLSDPRGTVARRERLALSEAGFEAFNYTSQDSAASGTWEASLYLIGRNDTRTMIGQTSVQVREFAPDTMRVRATLSTQNAAGWVKPDALSVTVAAENLFGTPAQKRKVEGTMVLRPAFPSFPAYPDYRFYDPMLAKEGYDEQLTDQTTDDKGNAVFKLDLSKYAKATYQLNFLARAFEPGSGRNVAAQASTLVSSNDFLIGIKAVDGLDYVKRKDKRSVQLLAIGPDGKPRAVTGLHAVVVEKRFVSVLTKQDSGLYRYVSHERRYPLKDRAIDLAATAQAFALPTDQPGNFVLEMRSADGTVLNQIAYSVAGAANLSRSLERNAELTLSLSKPRYKPGETIEISVRAPYAGSGLITIERDRVYAQAWFRSDTTSSVQTIRVPADFEGNGYVNVQFLRDPSSDEIFMSPLTFGVAPFAVDRTARTQPLEIKLPAVVRPGALIPVDIKTSGKARVVVFAVDEGILQVARYKVGDPLDFFFTKKSLQVDTAQILDLLLPEFSRLAAMAAPGGDGGGDLAKNLNPFKRKAEKPAVWWSGIIDVDGTRRVEFRLPDHFNGRIRVTAVAVTADKLGIAETQATVRGDFVLTPTVPTHVAPGDEFELPVGIANTIEGARTSSLVNAYLELPPSLTLVGAAPAPISIAPGNEGTVRFRVRAGSALGAVAVVIRAKSGSYQAQRRIEVSLRPGIVARQDLRAGHAEQRIILEKLRVMYNPLSTRQLAASSSPLVAVDGLTAYLRGYPYLCTEQLLSQAMPALVYSSRPELGHSVDRATGDRGNLIDVLRSRQNSEGGLGVWTAMPDADPFVTGYAALYLLESRERGIAVPEDMLTSLNSYLETLAADASHNDLPFLRQRAMAVYLLVRQGRTASNLLSAVQEQLKRDQPKTWQDDAAGMLVAASYQLLQQDKPARALAVKGLGRVNAPGAAVAVDDYFYYYDSGIEQAWTLYLLNRHFPTLARQVKPAALEKLMAPLRENRFNTLSSALTVLALDAQAGALGNPPPATLQAAGKDGAARQIGKVRGVVTAGNFTGADTRLWVTPASAAPVWYVLNQSGYDRSAPATTQNNGLEVLRDYLDDQGKPISTLTLGQEVTVRLRVRALGAKARGQIAIVDLLPGGFEAVLQTPAVAATPAADAQGEESEGEGEGDTEGDYEDGEDYTPSVVPLALPGSTYTPEHIELREDRVVLYGGAWEKVVEFRYKLRANNAGTFLVPPIYAESMYQRSVFAQGGPAGSLKVAAPPP